MLYAYMLSANQRRTSLENTRVFALSSRPGVALSSRPGCLHYPLDHSHQVKSSPSHIFVKFYHNRVLPISLHITYGGCFCVTTFDRDHVACKANNFCYLALYRTIPGPLLFLYSTAHIFTFLVAVLPGWQLNDVREVLANAMMMIILKQTNVSNQHMVCLKLTQCYM